MMNLNYPAKVLYNEITYGYLTEVDWKLIELKDEWELKYYLSLNDDRSCSVFFDLTNDRMLKNKREYEKERLHEIAESLGYKRIQKSEPEKSLYNKILNFIKFKWLNT